MLIHLPDPVAARVNAVRENCVEFQCRDTAQADAFAALVGKALRDGYAVEIRLIHYEGQPDMERQAAARKRRKVAQGEDPENAPSLPFAKEKATPP